MSFARSSLRWMRVALAGLLLAHAPLDSEDITVEGDCTLVEAINAANNDDDSGGLCPPGGFGPDNLILTGDVLLTEVDHVNPVIGGDSGLPLVTSTIGILGNGFTVARDTSAPDFRIFDVDSGGDLDLSELTVSGGSRFSGTAVLTTRGGFTTLIDSTLSGNTGGPAAYMWDVWGYGGFTLLIDSTVSGNDGAGLRNYYGRLILFNSTVSGNGSGSYGDGVSTGIYSYTYLEQTTIAGNHGAGLSNDGVTNVTGSIVTGSGASDCEGDTAVTGVNNFDGDGSCAGFGDLTGFDPVLADNGGPTRTHAIFEGSSAVDAAGICGITRDQRGEPRNGDCDSGSFELQGEPQEGISGTASGLVSLAGNCGNRATGSFVPIPRQPEGAYVCEGLATATGDAVAIQLRGTAAGGLAVRGSVEGMVLVDKVICRNLSTQQVVAAPRTLTQWHCSSGGFAVGEGDRIVLEITGTSL